MRKLFLLFVCLFALHAVVRADDDKPIKVNQLPQKAQQFIKQHFAGCHVALAKMESDLFDKNYDVIFTDGNKVEFDKRGEWTEVNCKHSVVPAAIVPSSIRDYVTAQYPTARILKIERDRKDYEVKLSNGWELKFDLMFNLIDIDK